MSYIDSYRTQVAIGICALLLQGAALSAQQNPAPAAAAPTSTSSQAPVAEIDAIAYENLRNNAQQIYNAVGSLPGSSNGFVIYDRRLFSHLPNYRPAVREVDELRRNLCQAKASLPAVTGAAAFDLSGVGTFFTGIAGLLALFKPSLSVTGLELPPSDQVLIADFANVAGTQNPKVKVFIPTVSPPNLEPDDPFVVSHAGTTENQPCPLGPDTRPSEQWQQASLLQEWRATGIVEQQVAIAVAKLKDADLKKKLNDLLDAYAATLKKYVTTDASGNSPLASLVTAGRLELLLHQDKPLILVLSADDVGGAGWIKDKAFTVPVTFSGGASAHYFVFDSAMDSSVITSGSVTSFNTQLKSEKIDSTLAATLKTTKIELASPLPSAKAQR